MPRQDAYRRSQEERSAETRGRLLEAAIDCLLELGWAATTTPDVAKRAGLSRGAQQHHFPTKADLMVDVAKHVTRTFHDDLRRELAELPQGPGRARAGIDLFVRAYSGRGALAHTELWVAARTDPELHDALYEAERTMVPETRTLLRRVFSDTDEYGPQLDIFVDITSRFIHGLVLRSMLKSDSHWIKDDLEGWRQIAEVVVPSIEAGSGLLALPAVGPDSSSQAVRT